MCRIAAVTALGLQKQGNDGEYLAAMQAAPHSHLPHAYTAAALPAGKQSLARLAAFICGHEVFQIAVSSTYGVNEFKAVRWNTAGMAALACSTPWCAATKRVCVHAAGPAATVQQGGCQEQPRGAAAHGQPAD